MATPTAAVGVVANGTVPTAATLTLTYSVQTVSASLVAAPTDGVDLGSSPALVQALNLSPVQSPMQAKTRPGEISRHRSSSADHVRVRPPQSVACALGEGIQAHAPF